MSEMKETNHMGIFCPESNLFWLCSAPPPFTPNTSVFIHHLPLLSHLDREFYLSTSVLIISCCVMWNTSDLILTDLSQSINGFLIVRSVSGMADWRCNVLVMVRSCQYIAGCLWSCPKPFTPVKVATRWVRAFSVCQTCLCLYWCQRWDRMRNWHGIGPS